MVETFQGPRVLTRASTQVQCCFWDLQPVQTEKPHQKDWGAAWRHAQGPTGPELSTRSSMDCIKALICQMS